MAVRIVWARCSAVYHGRGDTVLPAHDRLIIVKDDGSVGLHGAEGVKPLNYMGAKTKFSVEERDGKTTWMFDSSKESLTITIHHLYGEMNPNIPVGDPGLIRDGTEPQLQEWLAENLTALLPHLVFAQREFQTGVGPVDLLAHDPIGTPVIIEVKRVATRAAVHQVRRYLDSCQPGTQALIIAVDVRPSARDFAIKKNIPWVQLDWTDRNAPHIVSCWGVRDEEPGEDITEIKETA